MNLGSGRTRLRVADSLPATTLRANFSKLSSEERELVSDSALLKFSRAAG